MVRPRIECYLDSLQHQLDAQSDGIKMQLRALRSDGGLASVKLAKEFSSNLLYSGPAGGIKGVAANIATKTEWEVTCLMVILMPKKYLTCSESVDI